MDLKKKISFIISLLFTIIFAVSAVVIYVLSAEFRKEEFENRLKEKAMSSIKLLVEVEQVDRQLLKIIDQNSINKLYEEKTLIFDANYNLIYSSLDDTKIKWETEDLNYLKINKNFYRKEKDQETYGVFYDTNANDYYALISANDSFGKRKLEYLLSILVITYFILTIICWFATFYIVKRLLYPIDVFHAKIKGINENNLDIRIPVKTKKDEIDLLANEFNLMLGRIDISYQKQKEFTAHASHELRTPIARITTQIENKLLDKTYDIEAKGFFKRLLLDINQISDLISSLLLLSKLDKADNSDFELCRIDEIIFEANERFCKINPKFKLQLDIQENDIMENYLTITGNKALLLIVFSNLFNNAYLYSDSKQASVFITAKQNHLEIQISNDGEVLQSLEQLKLFQPFMRGENSRKKSGLGLGLLIAQRILLQHNAEISYASIDNRTNLFRINFKLFLS